MVCQARAGKEIAKSIQIASPLRRSGRPPPNISGSRPWARLCASSWPRDCAKGAYVTEVQAAPDCLTPRHAQLDVQ